MPRSRTYAKWHDHANGVHPSDNLRDWLTDRVSLTYKLMAHCQQFRVQRLRQQRALCLADEWQRIALPRRLQVQERDVLLRCDGRPMVLGHTVVALDATTTEWPFFSTLGERSLGTTLFGDPLVARGQLPVCPPRSRSSAGAAHVRRHRRRRFCLSFVGQALDLPPQNRRDAGDRSIFPRDRTTAEGAAGSEGDGIPGRSRFFPADCSGLSTTFI